MRKDGYENDFKKIEEIFMKHNVLHTCEMGKAKIINVKIKDIFDITRRYLEKDIGFLLTSESKKLLKKNLKK